MLEAAASSALYEQETMPKLLPRSSVLAKFDIQLRISTSSSSDFFSSFSEQKKRFEMDDEHSEVAVGV